MVRFPSHRHRWLGGPIPSTVPDTDQVRFDLTKELLF
jgi:hypothetical protein